MTSRGALEPHHCQFFCEPLLYLFYGRPAYQVSLDNASTSWLADLPVCFVLKPECLSDIVRLYPFDTGAFKRDLYTQYLDPRMTLERFAMPPEFHMMQRFVLTFFGSNQSYYQGAPLEQVRHSPFAFEVEAYHRMIKDRGRSVGDDRRATVEVQTRTAIPMTKENVIAVICPAPFWNTPELVDIVVKQWDAVPLSYSIYHMQPTAYTSEIKNLVHNCLVEKGYL